MLGGLGIGVTEFVMMGLLPDIATKLGVSIPVAGYLISAYALGVVVGAPLLVVFAGRLPLKKLLIGLMIIFTVFNALSILAPNFEFLFVSRFLAGLPHGAFFGVGAVAASQLATKGREARAIAVMFAGLTIANLFGVPLGTYLGHEYGWRYAFVLIAGIGLLTIISLKFWVPHLENPSDGNIKKQLSFFSRVDTWLIILITSIGTGGLFCWMSYIAPLLTEVSGFTQTQLPYLMSFAGLGMLVGNILGGWLTDRFAPGRTTLWLMLSMAASLVLVATLSYYKPTAILMTFITGALAFSLAAPIQMLMIQSAKGAELIAAAVAQASFNIGNALGAYLGGLPLMAGFSFTSPEWVGASMALFGAGITGILIVFQNNNTVETSGKRRMAFQSLKLFFKHNTLSK